MRSHQRLTNQRITTLSVRSVTTMMKKVRLRTSISPLNKCPRWTIILTLRSQRRSQRRSLSLSAEEEHRVFRRTKLRMKDSSCGVNLQLLHSHNINCTSLLLRPRLLPLKKKKMTSRRSPQTLLSSCKTVLPTGFSSRVIKTTVKTLRRQSRSLKLN